MYSANDARDHDPQDLHPSTARQPSYPSYSPTSAAFPPISLTLSSVPHPYPSDENALSHHRFSPSPAPTYRTDASSPAPSSRPPRPALPLLRSSKPVLQPTRSHVDTMAEKPRRGAEEGPFFPPPTKEDEPSNEMERLSFETRGSAEHWTDGSIRRGSDAASLASSRSGWTLEGMSEVETAQRHFRMAQQHLEAARRLAAAAAAQSNRPSPSSSSAYASSLESPSSSSTRHTFHSPVPVARGAEEPVVSPDERSLLASEFGALSLEGTDLAATALNTASVLQRAPSASAAASSRRPQPPAPARAASLGGTAGLPSLDAVFSGGNGASLRRSASVSSSRYRAEPDLASLSPAGYAFSESGHGEDWDDSFSSFSHATSTSSLPPYEAAWTVPASPPPVPPIPPQFASSLASPSSPPASLAQPELYAGPSLSAARTLAESGRRGHAHQPSADSTVIEEFHGFRPRVALRSPSSFPTLPTPSPTTPSAPSPRPSPSAPSSASSLPHPYSFSQPRPPLPAPTTSPLTPHTLHSPLPLAASVVSTSHLQPHSYILGPTGQPIPVYAAPPFAARPATAQAQPGAPASKRSRRPKAAPTGAPAPSFSSSQHGRQPSSILLTSPTYVSSPPSSAYSASSPYSATSPVSASTSSVTFAPSPASAPSPLLPTPSRASASSSSASSLSAPGSSSGSASGLRRGMASLKGRMPTVRFKSPEPVERERDQGAEDGVEKGKEKGGWRWRGRREEEKTAGGEEEGRGGEEEMTEEERVARQAKAAQFSMGMLM